MHRRTDPAATAHSDRPRQETSTTQEVSWNMKFDERGRFVSAMQKKYIIIEKDEVPAIEAFNAEQANLVGNLLRKGIEHHQFRDACLK
jgi:hypothetical protein